MKKVNLRSSLNASKQNKNEIMSPVGKAIEVEVEGVVAGEEEVTGGGHHPMKEAPQEAKKALMNQDKNCWQ